MNRQATPYQTTVSEIRAKGQKPNYQTQGNWLARRWARPMAVYGTWIALRLGLSANTITAFAMLVWICECICLGLGTPVSVLAGVCLGFAGFWLDHVDGQVARTTGGSSLEGVFFDFWMHTAHGLLRAFGLGWGCFQATGNEMMVIAGMATAFGWTMLSQFNDAKYKAIFAFLKSTNTTLIVNHQADRLPIQSNNVNPDIFSIFSQMTFLVTKLQEPHMVLGMELLISITLFINARIGINLWVIFLLIWSFGSVSVAFARLVRSIQKRRISSEFDSYFKPYAEGNHGQSFRRSSD